MTPYISNVTVKTTVIMDYGEIRCIFCHERLPLNKYPHVGRVLRCNGCLGFMVVQGHYLGYNHSVQLAISNLTQEQIEKVNRMIINGTI